MDPNEENAWWVAITLAPCITGAVLLTLGAVVVGWWFS